MSVHGDEPLGYEPGDAVVLDGSPDEPVGQPRLQGGFGVHAGGEQYRIRRDGEDAYQVFRESDTGVVWCAYGRRDGEFKGEAHPEVVALAPRLMGWA